MNKARSNLHKRYFSTETARALTARFHVELLDDQGETYKDRAIGVHRLARFIGRK